MTREEKLKLLLDTGEYDFIKNIPKENMWKLIFALAYIEDTIPMSDIDGIKADNIFEKLTYEERGYLWMYMIFNRDKILEKMDEWTKEADKAGMTLIEYLESINPLDTNKEEKPPWLGKNCKDCGNEKCKKLGKLPKGYDCALWQEKKEKNK